MLQHGAAKYGENNWQKVEPRSRYIAAALRHLNAHQQGERNDPETGLSHLAHATCCLLFLLHFEKSEGTLTMTFPVSGGFVDMNVSLRDVEELFNPRKQFRDEMANKGTKK